MHKFSKSEVINSFLSTKYEILFNPDTGRSQYKKLDAKNYSDITVDVIASFHSELSENGISVTKTDVQKALNMKFFDKQKDLGQYEEIEMLLDTYMDCRFNTIKQKPEYRIHNQMDNFIPLDRYSINSINRYIRSKGLKTSKDALNDIMFSDYADMVNPIKEYFEQLPGYSDTERDYILELANTVNVKNPEKWVEYLKKWLVAVVANAMIDENCKNHTMLVLTGEQGAFKTTWLDNLCPIPLRPYLYTGKIDPSNKDTQTLLAEFFLVNVDDQLKQLNKKDENDLKNMITAPNVKYRRPYDVFIQEYPHVCSFMGSVNGNEFLTDPTGSRRFLAFEVVQIDIDSAQVLDMNLVWKQAYHLFNSKFRYWFTHEEIEELHYSNMNFQVISMEEQFLLQYFAKPEYREQATHHMQPAEILSYIQIRTGGVRIRSKLLGEALTKHGFDKWRKTTHNNQKNVYSVIMLNSSEIDDAQRDINEPQANSTEKPTAYSWLDIYGK